MGGRLTVTSQGEPYVESGAQLVYTHAAVERADRCVSAACCRSFILTAGSLLFRV
jgi:hypothetical protein